jgi:acetoin utilization protein AcuB
MISDSYICFDIEPFSIKLKVSEAIERMHKLHVDLMPVVKDERLINYVAIEDLEEMDGKSNLEDLHLYAPILPFVTLNQHLLSVLTHLKTLNVSLMAVLDEQGVYQGVLKTRDVVKALSSSISIKNSGSIIVLRIKPIDYSLSELSRVIEYSDAKIIGLLLFEIEGQEDLEVHLKLNTSTLANCLSALERHGYYVAQYFNREDAQEDLDSRYANLMKFIDL